MDTANVLSQFGARRKDIRNTYHKFVVEGMTMGKNLEEECKQGHISPNELKAGSRRRRVSTLRATIAKRGMDELGLSMAEIVRHVGVTMSSIAKAVARLEEEG